MKRPLFTPEELEELRRVDSEIDAAPLNYEDWKSAELAEALLFPEREKERAKRREYSRRTYERNAEKLKQYSREYYQAHREEIRARKRAWYKASRERILAQQKEYRRRKSGITEEEREAHQATAKERKRAKDLEYQRKRREAAKQGAGGLTAPRFSTPVFTPYTPSNRQKSQYRTGRKGRKSADF